MSEGEEESLDSYMYNHHYVLRRHRLGEREECYQPKQECQWVGDWRHAFDRPRAFFGSRIAGRLRHCEFLRRLVSDGKLEP